MRAPMTAQAIPSLSIIAMTWDGTALRTYVNGTVRITTTATGATTMLATTQAPLIIGCNPENMACFNGWFDEFRVWNIARTDQQIMGAVFERNGPRVFWFSEEYRQLQKVLDGFFPGLVVRIIGSDEGQRIFLVSTYSDRQPVIYKWVDLEKRRLAW